MTATIKQLEAFILDQNLEKLEAELNKFNLMDVFNGERDEKKHSAIIGWFLDPSNNHGLKDYFLSEFLKEVLYVNKDNSHAKISLIDVDFIDFTDVIVFFEEKFQNNMRGDISIISERNKIYVIIENKIKSNEGINQTTSYVEQVEKTYPDYNKLFIFLTPEGISAESEQFLSFSYSDLYNVIKRVITNKGDVINNKTEFVLTQLMQNIEVNIMEEGKIEELCAKIHKKHRDASEHIANLYKLSKAEREELLPSGKQTIIYNRVGWARTYMKKSGLLQSPRRGFARITERGLKVLEQYPEVINDKFLEQFPEFIEFQTIKKEQSKVKELDKWQKKDIDEMTPDELLEKGYNLINADLSQDLINKLRVEHFSVLERIVLRLLTNMGYGEGKVTGQTGDGGVDGFINEDKLGLDKIYFQAKRFNENNPVSSSMLRDFIGALELKGVKKECLSLHQDFRKMLKK